MKRFVITQRGIRSTEITRQMVVEVPDDEKLDLFKKHLCDGELETLADEAGIPWEGGLPDDAPDRHYVRVSKAATVFWGLYAIGFAQFANHLGSLIEAVNIMGSLFYGTILGIFLIAFYFKRIGGNATFIAAIVAELTVLACFFFTKIPYLWFNVIGCVLLVSLASAMNPLFSGGKKGMA